MLTLGLAFGLGAIAVLVPSVFAGDPRAVASLAPQQCVCSAGLDLAAAGQPPSILRNCQCGALQCVVHVGSGQLQCR